MSSSVMRPIEEEGSDMDGAEGMGGVARPDRLEQNCASLRLTVAWSMAHIKGKWSKKGKGTENGIKST